MDQKKEKKPPKQKKPLWLRILIILVSVILFLGLALFAAYHIALEYYLGKIQYETEVPSIEYETVAEPEDEEAKNKAEEMQGNAESPLIADTEHITNILLIGEDRSETGKAGNTDVMLLVSINTETKKILMCSFMRDLYLEYPAEPANPCAGNFWGLNAAYRYGGPELTLAVIRKNFNLDIQYYAKVDFVSFANVVDTIGGVSVPLAIEEIEIINREQNVNAKFVGYEDYYLEPLPLQEGNRLLNGAQALTFARMRKIDSDWQRTGRQRMILSAMLQKVPNLSLGQMMETMEVLLPQITTNMPKEMLKKMVSSLFEYSSYSIEQASVPADGKFVNINYYMVPDLEYNRFYLYEKVMGKRANGDPR